MCGTYMLLAQIHHIPLMIIWVSLETGDTPNVPYEKWMSDGSFWSYRRIWFPSLRLSLIQEDPNIGLLGE